MKNKKRFKLSLGDIVFIVLFAGFIFLIDYARVTECKGTSVYVKCHNYFGDE